jgi:hypothetical protein
MLMSLETIITDSYEDRRVYKLDFFERPPAPSYKHNPKLPSINYDDSLRRIVEGT